MQAYSSNVHLQSFIRIKLFRATGEQKFHFIWRWVASTQHYGLKTMAHIFISQVVYVVTSHRNLNRTYGSRVLWFHSQKFSLAVEFWLLCYITVIVFVHCDGQCDTGTTSVLGSIKSCWIATFHDYIEILIIGTFAQPVTALCCLFCSGWGGKYSRKTESEYIRMGIASLWPRLFLVGPPYGLLWLKYWNTVLAPHCDDSLNESC